MRATETNHSRAEVGLPLISEVPGGTEARRALGLIDQVDCCRAQDFSLRGRAGLRSARSDGFFTLPRIDRYLPETLNELQVEQLLESVDCEAPLGLRDRADAGTALRQCLRISELAGAKLENLNLEEGVVRVTGKGTRRGSSR